MIKRCLVDQVKLKQKSSPSHKKKRDKISFYDSIQAPKNHPETQILTDPQVILDHMYEADPRSTKNPRTSNFFTQKSPQNRENLDTLISPKTQNSTKAANRTANDTPTLNRLKKSYSNAHVNREEDRKKLRAQELL